MSEDVLAISCCCTGNVRDEGTGLPKEHCEEASWTWTAPERFVKEQERLDEESRCEDRDTYVEDESWCGGDAEECVCL